VRGRTIRKDINKEEKRSMINEKEIKEELKALRNKIEDLRGYL